LIADYGTLTEQAGVIFHLLNYKIISERSIYGWCYIWKHRKL